MTVDFKELKTALYGAVDIKEKDGYLCPRRFTDRQFEHFVKTENYIHKLWKGRSSAGMELDFYTDSDFVEFEAFCFRAATPKEFFFDIYVDGEFYRDVEILIDEEGEIKAYCKLPSGEKRVTVYFSAFYSVNIKSFLLSDGAYFKKAEKKRKLLFLGDSITQGYTALHPSCAYTSILCRGLDAQCVNQGIGANVFNADDLDAKMPYNPDALFVAYGTNDWTHNRDIKTEAGKYLKKLTEIYCNAKIYVILPIWRGRLDEHEQKTIITFDKMHEILENTCKDFADVTVIDGRELVPNDMTLFRADKTHPTEDGFRHYGNNLLKKLKELEK
ncbi:MAG: SGNH/GDSL hydrolase family protein [Ruminococcaceae bacterium]|nr:SGNH/GDSL hydrolase family protein [Oscillospiraceae bacterium]